MAHAARPETALVEAKLNDPNVPNPEKIALLFTDDAEGRSAAKDTVDRLKAAVAAATIPDDFSVSKKTTVRQTRARTVLWNGSNENFDALKNIRIPVLVTNGCSDVVDPPKNSLTIANQIPFSAGVLPGRARLRFPGAPAVRRHRRRLPRVTAPAMELKVIGLDLESYVPSQRCGPRRRTVVERASVV